jgi:hypothetical protein
MRKMRLLAAAAVALFALAGTAAAHPDDPIDDGVVEGQHGGTGGHLPASSSNVQLVGKLRVTPAGTTGYIADVATFRNYAYLNQFSPGCADDQRGGTYIINISNPASPAQVGFITSPLGTFPGEGAHVVHLETASFTGDLLAVNLETCTTTGHGGFALYDVTNPLAPVTLVESAGDPTPGFQGGANRYHSVFVWQQAGKAYLVGSDDEEQGTGDVDIWDISNPRAPVMISQTGLPNFAGAVVNAFGSRSFNHDMVVEKLGNTWTLLSSYWDAGYVKLNVNDPANPKFIDDSDFTHPDPEFPSFEIPEGNGHYAEFDRRGQFIIGTDEDFSPFRTQLEIQTGSFAGFYEAAEGSASRRITTLPDQAMNDGTTFLGFGCNPDGSPLTGPVAPEDGDPNTEEIAVFQRGGPGATCPAFQNKANTAQALGYDGFIVFNDAARGDGLVTMAVTSPLPGIFVGHSTGKKLFGNTVPPIGTTGEQVRADSRFDGWGYIHLFDGRTLREIDTYAVPETKQEDHASGFGTMSVHEVTFDRNSNLAYLAWYDAGFRVVKYGPDGIEEVGHFIDVGGNDFWGVQLPSTAQGQDLVLASDRDAGLYIFRYTGPK